MRIPRFWARGFYESQDSAGNKQKFISVRWSDLSIDDARSQAMRVAREVAARFTGQSPLEHYAYADQPLREERVREILGDDREPIAVITRNSYGSLVLNTAHVMFIDIDFPKSSSIITSLKRAFGIGPSAESELLARVSAWAHSHPQFTMRIYRTCNGLRALVSHDIFDPISRSTEEILTSIGCDPLYLILCKSQACFRARLTPKHWRIGEPRPPHRYPFNDVNEETKNRAWEKQYENACKGFTTCRYLTTLGQRMPHRQATKIIEEHDRVACVPNCDELR